MRRRDIPYVVKGLNRLFDSPEIQAVVGIFRYMAGRRRGRDLKALWEDAALLPETPTGPRRLRSWTTVATSTAASGGASTTSSASTSSSSRRSAARGDASRGRRARELVFYQLGKFSQAISDFEQIYFNTEPGEKYESFAWLEYQAPGYYAESDADVGYATPDAVTLTTVHQAKGMQWPACLHPCLRKNRFPSKRHGGVGLFHVIPEAAIADADRYRGTVEDETRLFYVAVTRAQKYLFVSFSPGRQPALQAAVGLLRPLSSQQVVLDETWRAGGRAAARAAGPCTRRRRSRLRSRS